MPAPIIGAVALAAARVLAAQVAKQTGKKLTQNQMKAIAIKVASRPKSKVSRIEARRIAEKAAGPKARSMGGEAPLRATKPKPGVRITLKTSGGGQRVLEGPAKKINVKLKQKAEGPSRLVGKEFKSPPSRVREVSAEKRPSISTEKITVKKPIKRSTNKDGSAITVRQGTPRKPADVRARMQKERRDRLRESLTPRVNPARPKTTPKRGATSERTSAREQEIIDRYYRIRFRDQGGPTPRSAQGKQGSIESRIASGSEKPTRGRSASSDYDKEAETLLNRSIRAIENPKIAAKERVKPGKRTKVAIAVKGGKPSEIKGATRNMRKVLREREIKETAERMRKAEEAAKKRGSK